MNIYESLRIILDAHPSGAPKSPSFDKILRILFTEEEASLAVHMSFRPKTVQFIAEKAAIDESQAKNLLESMADKAIIFSKKKEGNFLYGLVPTIPGIFEFPFMKGGDFPHKKELSELWTEYHEDGMGDSFSGNPTPMVRVVPVQKSIVSENQVHPYEEVKDLIYGSQFLAVAECACRESIKKCDAPTDVCLIFGSAAESLSDRGFAKKINKEEGLEILKRSEDAGLIHTSNNSMDGANFICNCCSCCCTILRGQTELKNPHAFSTSRFYASVSDDLCTGCEICVEERCPVEAIEMKDGIAVVKDEKCIGCGLCVTGCPSEAMKLLVRQTVPEIPQTVQELGLKVIQEKGKLEKFMDIMKR